MSTAATCTTTEEGEEARHELDAVSRPPFDEMSAADLLTTLATNAKDDKMVLRMLESLPARLQRTIERGEKGIGALLEKVDIEQYSEHKNSREAQNHWEDVVDLRDKCVQGLSIVEEHLDDRLPPAARVRLECQVYSEVEDGMAHVEQMCVEFNELVECGDKVKQDGVYEHNKWLTRHLDQRYSELHCQFLETFLNN